MLTMRLAVARVATLFVLSLAACSCATRGPDSASQSAALDEPVVCRDELLPGSNVMTLVCLTPSQWTEFNRRRRADAQELTRAMRGSYSIF
jgi:hypothetical protein